MLHDRVEDGFRVLTTACDRDAAEACLLLGYEYLNGGHVETDPGRASELFARACELGDEQGCVQRDRAAGDWGTPD